MKLSPNRVRPWLVRLLMLAVAASLLLLLSRFALQSVPAPGSPRGRLSVVVDRRPPALEEGHLVRFLHGNGRLGSGRILAVEEDQDRRYLVREDPLWGDRGAAAPSHLLPRERILDRVLVVLW